MTFILFHQDGIDHVGPCVPTFDFLSYEATFESMNLITKKLQVMYYIPGNIYHYLEWAESIKLALTCKNIYHHARFRHIEICDKMNLKDPRFNCVETIQVNVDRLISIDISHLNPRLVTIKSYRCRIKWPQYVDRITTYNTTSISCEMGSLEIRNVSTNVNFVSKQPHEVTFIDCTADTIKKFNKIRRLFIKNTTWSRHMKLGKWPNLEYMYLKNCLQTDIRSPVEVADLVSSSCVRRYTDLKHVTMTGYLPSF